LALTIKENTSVYEFDFITFFFCQNDVSYPWWHVPRTFSLITLFQAQILRLTIWTEKPRWQSSKRVKECAALRLTKHARHLYKADIKHQNKSSYFNANLITRFKWITIRLWRVLKVYLLFTKRTAAWGTR
jgi:hypothetical protein